MRIPRLSTKVEQVKQALARNTASGVAVIAKEIGGVRRRLR